MRNVRLTLQYDGTRYSGWQVQENAVTIQGLLEDALSTITGERTRIAGAARTDAGVHAFGQIASFKTLSDLHTDVLLRALNANLPYDIRIIGAGECPADFHPRYSAKEKTYSFIISQKGPYSVFLERYSWNMPYKVNCEAIREAASHLVGTHDFTSFRASGCSSKHPVRTIHGIEISELSSVEFIGFQFNAPVIRIRIRANAFLRHMARNVAGTLVEIGRGKNPPAIMKEILESKDRKNAGRTAPACGLFLEKIEY